MDRFRPSDDDITKEDEEEVFKRFFFTTEKRKNVVKPDGEPKPQSAGKPSKNFRMTAATAGSSDGANAKKTVENSLEDFFNSGANAKKTLGTTTYYSGSTTGFINNGANAKKTLGTTTYYSGSTTGFINNGANAKITPQDRLRDLHNRGSTAKKTSGNNTRDSYNTAGFSSIAPVVPRVFAKPKTIRKNTENSSNFGTNTKKTSEPDEIATTSDLKDISDLNSLLKAIKIKSQQEHNYIKIPFGSARKAIEEASVSFSANTSKADKDILSHKTPIKMPSGKYVAIGVPAKSNCTCDKLSETIYTPLRANEEEYKVIVNEMNSTVRKHVSGSFSRCDVVSIKKVKNCCLWLRYKNRQRDIAKEKVEANEVMLFHGSAACHEICTSGFDERHSNQSGMFGAGVYFAQHSSKSNQYVFGYMGGNGCFIHHNANCTSCLRKMLLCRVTLGNTKKLTQANKMSHAPPGFHSVSGAPTPGGLLYEEYVIYRGEQAYPEYEITYTIK